MIIMVASELKVFDATCPLVTKLHVEIAKMRNPARLSFVTQTSRSVDDALVVIEAPKKLPFTNIDQRPCSLPFSRRSRKLGMAMS